ncbi:MAG TPA: heavy-metal-associated domain-containing protein [Anaerolineales bacterium]
MKKITLDLPAMYGDHHVVEVRRILLAIPGVGEVYASSSFRAVEVTYDPEKVNDLEIQIKLDEAGYLGEWSILAEPGVPVARKNGEGSFRHTAVYEQTRQVVSFAQKVGSVGRPLWPCPGMGVIQSTEEEG